MFNLKLFNEMFPTYGEFKIPMWSEWREDEKSLRLKVTVPSYSKKDFTLYIEGDSLFLRITNTLHYSIVDNLDLYKVDHITTKYRNGILTITIPKV